MTVYSLCILQFTESISSNFLVEPNFPCISIQLSAYSGRLTSSSPIWMLLFIFPVTAVARTYKTILNKSGRVGILILFPILEEKPSAFYWYDGSCGLI